MTTKKKRSFGVGSAAALMLVCVLAALLSGMWLGYRMAMADMETQVSPAPETTGVGTEETPEPAASNEPDYTDANEEEADPTAAPEDDAEEKNEPSEVPDGLSVEPGQTAGLTDGNEDGTEQTGVQNSGNAVPVNPMTNEPEAAVETEPIRRPLVHADRIREALEKQALPLYGVKIGIDPGHQAKANNGKEPVAPGSTETKAKVSSGTQGVSTRVPEYVVNLEVSLQLRDMLEALGAEVHMTRETNDVDISNVERAEMMNELGVDLVLRIHCNGSTNASTTGIGLYVKPSGDGAEESYAASEALLPSMAEATGARAMGIYKRDTYSGLNWSTVPSILVEMGFMSNKEEDRLLNDPEYQQKLVLGMVQGIADYMGRELNE